MAVGCKGRGEKKACQQLWNEDEQVLELTRSESEENLAESGSSASVIDRLPFAARQYLESYRPLMGCDRSPDRACGILAHVTVMQLCSRAAQGTGTEIFVQIHWSRHACRSITGHESGE